MSLKSTETRMIHCPTCKLDKLVKRTKNSGMFPVHCSGPCARKALGVRTLVTSKSNRFRLSPGV